jgi:putative transferase (TIGR04331 family)
MTANAFAYDEIWSAWAAKLIEKGSKLIIAQHGGKYGSAEFTPSFDYELKISDKYISWGWDVHNSKKIVKGPAVKLINLRKRNKNLGKKCLLVLISEPRYSIGVGFNEITKDLPKYLSDQFRFASTLSKAIQNELQIRLYFEDFGWDVKDRWKIHFPEVELVDRSIKIKKLLKNTKICVCTYNSTTFLETFTQNIPTILFWDPKIFQLNSDAQSFFDVLHKASILHFTPEDCAEFINSIWDDVPKWWNSIQVKQAIEIFSKRFAHVGPRPISQLKSILTDW